MFIAQEFHSSCSDYTPTSEELLERRRETQRGDAERRRGWLTADIRASRDLILIFMQSKPDLIIISLGKVKAGNSENNESCCLEMSWGLGFYHSSI